MNITLTWHIPEQTVSTKYSDVIETEDVNMTTVKARKIALFT